MDHKICRQNNGRAIFKRKLKSYESPIVPNYRYTDVPRRPAHNYFCVCQARECKWISDPEIA